MPIFNLYRQIILVIFLVENQKTRENTNKTRFL